MDNKKRDKILEEASFQLSRHLLDIVIAEKSIRSSDVNKIVKDAIRNAVFNAEYYGYLDADHISPVGRRTLKKTQETISGKWVVDE